MSNRKYLALQRKVARFFTKWYDPHDRRPYTEIDCIRTLEIKPDGEVNITLKPTRPHCPCCLLDLQSLKEKLSSIKGVTFVTIHVVDIPASQRWTRVLNG